jgi:hypothetical protein
MLCKEVQKYPLSHPLLSSSQGNHQHIYLGIAPSLPVCFWWSVPFPDKIVAKTMLHLKNDLEKTLF